MALVSEESLVNLIQKQDLAFKNMDLERFISYYLENLIVQNFHNDTLYEGKSKLKLNYKDFFFKNPNANVEVLKRIHKGNIVIDEERININGTDRHRVVLYEIVKGQTVSKSFIKDKGNLPEAEAIIEKQLEAFNTKKYGCFC